MLVKTEALKNKLKEIEDELPSYESAWLAIQMVDEYLTELENETATEEMDLEKEIDKTVNECTDGYNFDWDKFAKHFYELGKQAKKEE